MDIDQPKRYVVGEIKRFGKQAFGKLREEIETKKLGEAKGGVDNRGKHLDTCSPHH
jgi:hypothetical protein